MMHYNALGAKKYFIFIIKKYIHYEEEDMAGILEPVGDGNEI